MRLSQPPLDAEAVDRAFREYFRSETLKLQEQCLPAATTLAEFEGGRDTHLRQLREMFGLDPMPPKTDLKPVVTGRLEHADFTVEKLHFQSKPGLYVTGNLYLPKDLKTPAPAVLYLCGHARMMGEGVSYGNKTGYQHWGSWFARNGYVCLLIDTVQLGELQGAHGASGKTDISWWNSRGYSPAAVEAWNSIRALDYLETRPEVDRTRLGVTGRSGGGAYSWALAALDERIKVACPTAGIADLQNHVVDGCMKDIAPACLWSTPIGGITRSWRHWWRRVRF
jgi:acetyl esterase/lipase